MGTARKRARKAKAEPASRGLTPAEVAGGKPSAALLQARAAVEERGGEVLAMFRDPLGGNGQLLAALPLESVAPTPFQRDLSEPHVERLRGVLAALDRFLDPVIVVPAPEGGFWTPNGHHRLAALRKLGARSLTALVVPEPAVAFRILALNTEKAHNLREKALEVVRMARALAEVPGERRPEEAFALEFEEPAFLTLGLAYEERGRFSGGVYHPILRRADRWVDAPLPAALETRKALAARLLALDDAVVHAVAALKERGFQSPYLKAFVVARLNPLRFLKGDAPPLPKVLDRMEGAAERFDAGKIRPDQVARAGGPPEEA
ncbi:MAG TPA: ParB N-terminal domain-containing protein [Candidatus Polarisedimenticolaceae bacterium]|nr:ParB N-terminal domain-containing protein [Candidatus Polarisedimenticolaceae bacterium]